MLALWSDLRFESRTQSHQSFDKWITKILYNSETSRMLAKVGVRKALNLALTSNNRSLGDLEFFNSR